MYLHFAATLYPVGDPYRHTVIMQLAFRKPLKFFLNASCECDVLHPWDLVRNVLEFVLVAREPKNVRFNFSEANLTGLWAKTTTL